MQPDPPGDQPPQDMAGPVGKPPPPPLPPPPEDPLLADDQPAEGQP